MKKTLIYIAVALIGLAGMLVYFRWSSAIRQPLNFSHSDHVHRNIKCGTCHNSKDLDVLPNTTACTSCHSDRKFPQEVQWVRVYRVAPDIIFSHVQHSQDPCATCHKDLVEGKRWIHESRFTMDFCMKCHEQRHANNTCAACHKNKR